MRTIVSRLAPVVLLAAMRAADLPPQNLPVMGGTGGSSFSRDCGAGRVLTGFRYRSGLVVDAIGISCRPVLADGTLGPETTVGTIAGGSGGTTEFKSCRQGMVLVGMHMYWGSYAIKLRGYCNPWDATTRKFTSADQQGFDMGTLSIPYSRADMEFCESKSQPASGIRGRSGAFVDALGVVCDEP